MLQRLRTFSDEQAKDGAVALTIPRGPSSSKLHSSSSSNIYGMHASASEKLLRRVPSEVIQSDALTLLRTPTSIGEEIPAAGTSAKDLGLPAVIARKLPLAMMLCTGTALTLVAQLVTDQGIAHPSVQVLAWVKFASTLVWSGLGTRLSPPPQPAPGPAVAGAGNPSASNPTRRAKSLMTLIGLLDVLSYALHCIGFALCGAALSTLIFAASSQLFTAALSWGALGRRFNRGQLCALGLVCIGLGVRGLASGSRQPAAAFDEDMIGPGQARAVLAMLGLRGVDSGSATGVAAMLASSAAYAAMSVAYEHLINTERALPSHADVMNHVAKIGVAANTLYQLAYTLPRWQRLVSAELAASGTSRVHAVALLALFGAVFNVHSYAQGKVFRSEGSLGVGLVNAVRGASVSAVCGAVLCSAVAPQHCLTRWSALSAVIISGGGIAWIVAEPLVQSPKATVSPLRHRHSRTMSLKTFKEES